VPKRRVSQFRSETSADEHGAPGSVRIWVAGVTADAARCEPDYVQVLVIY